MTRSYALSDAYFVIALKLLSTDWPQILRNANNESLNAHKTYIHSQYSVGSLLSCGEF